MSAKCKQRGHAYRETYAYTKARRDTVSQQSPTDFSPRGLKTTLRCSSDRCTRSHARSLHDRQASILVSVWGHKWLLQKGHTSFNAKMGPREVRTMRLCIDTPSASAYTNACFTALKCIMYPRMRPMWAATESVSDLSKISKHRTSMSYPPCK